MPASQQQAPVDERVPSQSQTRSLTGSGGGIPSGPVETAQEGPRRSGRTHQPRQQPDNVYSGMETTQVESLTDCLWEKFLGDSQNPQGPPEPQGQFSALFLNLSLCLMASSQLGTDGFLT